MATSGEHILSVNAQQIVKSALSKLGHQDAAQNIDGHDWEDSLLMLNMMIKMWEADDLHVWKMEDIILFLEKDKHEYSLGPAGDHATLTKIQTAIKTAASENDTSIDVDATASFSASDNIGVKVDDGSMHWTTVSSITDSDTLVLAAGLDDDAAVDNVVYGYTNKIERPLRLFSAERVEPTGWDVPLQVVSRDYYYSLGSKATSGYPSTLYYNPTLDNGTLYVFNPPTSAGDYLRLHMQYPIEIFENVGDTCDLPSQFFLAMVFNLAVILSADFPVDDSTLSNVKSQAAIWYDKASSYDVENRSLFIEPNYRITR